MKVRVRAWGTGGCGGDEMSCKSQKEHHSSPLHTAHPHPTPRLVSLPTACEPPSIPVALPFCPSPAVFSTHMAADPQALAMLCSVLLMPPLESYPDGLSANILLNIIQGPLSFLASFGKMNVMSKIQLFLFNIRLKLIDTNRSNVIFTCTRIFIFQAYRY